MTAVISVIVPCFNTGEFLLECVESIVTQNVPGLEVIVVDDGSTEATTREILTELPRQYPGVQLMRTEYRNVGQARNAGFGSSQGRFVLFLDSDDLVGKDYLIATMDALERRRDCGVAFTDIDLFGTLSGIWRTGPLWSPCEIYIQNYLQHCALIRREVLERWGGYNPNLWSSEDWDLWIKLHSRGVRFVKAEGGRAFYRQRAGSKLGQNRPKRPYAVNRIILNHRDAYGRVFGWPIREREADRIEGLLRACVANGMDSDSIEVLRRTRVYRQFVGYNIAYRVLRRAVAPTFRRLAA